MKIPNVWSEGFNSHEGKKLELLAAEYSRLHELPQDLAEWDPAELRKKILKMLNIGCCKKHFKDIYILHILSYKLTHI